MHATEDNPAVPPRPASAILYLNFQGATITKAASPDPMEDDAGRNISSGFGGNFPAFDSSAFDSGVIGRIVAKVRKHYEEFNLSVVTERPPVPTKYTMMMIGGEATSVVVDGGSDERGPSGIAKVDCGNRNPASVGAVFPVTIAKALRRVAEATGNPPPTNAEIEETIAVSISHEAGHSFGLLHVDQAGAIMNPWGEPSSDWRGGAINSPDALIAQCMGGGQNFKTWEDPRRILTRVFGTKCGDGGGESTPATGPISF